MNVLNTFTQWEWWRMRLLCLLGVVLLCTCWAAAPDNRQNEEEETETFGQAPASSVSEQPQASPVQMAQPADQPVATVIFNKGTIEQVLEKIAQQTGVTVIAKGQTVGQRVDIIAKDEPLEVILDKITSGKDWVWHKVNDGRYEIMDRRTYETTVLPKQRERKIFQPQYIKAEDFKNAIEGMLTKDIGKAAVDPRTNKVIVTDLPQVIEQIARLLEEIDVKPIVRVFYIRHADVDEIAKMLEGYKSAPGSIEVDPKTHQIIVTDTLQNIKRMELLVEVLDVGPEMRVYNINNIGFEGEVLEELTKAIERVVTEDAFWELNYRAGTLLVEDVPEVHEKIEKILAAFDRPSKQVLIQAEVIEASLDRTFNLGVDYDLSQDLFSAEQDGLFEGRIPTGSGDVTDNLGFINLREEFPTISLINKGGLQVSYLSSHLRAQLSAFMADTDTNVLLQPRLLVKNQEEATIFVGGEVPYLTTFFNRPGDTTYGYSQFTQNTVNEGLMVKIRPSISNNDLIEMYLKIENNKAEKVTRDAGTQGTIDLVGRRRQEAETVLVIPSGETRVLGGLINTMDQSTKRGIPLLSQIPYLGPILFGSRDETNLRRNILFFITPTVVEERGRRMRTYVGEPVEKMIAEIAPEEELLPEAELTTPTAMSVTPSEYGETTSPSLARARLPRVILSSEMPRDLPRITTKPALETEQVQAQPRTSSYEAEVAGPSGTFTQEVRPVVTSTQRPREASASARPTPRPTAVLGQQKKIDRERELDKEPHATPETETQY